MHRHRPIELYMFSVISINNNKYILSISIHVSYMIQYTIYIHMWYIYLLKTYIKYAFIVQDTSTFTVDCRLKYFYRSDAE